MKESDGDSFAQSIVDTMRDPLVVLDHDLRVVSAGRAFYDWFRTTPAETEGRLIYDLGNRQWDIPRLRALLEEILPQKTTFRDFEVEHRFEHIGRKVMLLNTRRITHERELDRILLVIEDVTARRDAEQARQEAETRFTEMVRNARDHSIFLTDPDGVITSWNVAAERIIGYTAEEAVGRHFSLIFTPGDVRAGLPEQELRQARESGRAEDERWHVRKDGEPFWALGIVTPLRDVDGRLTGFSKILRDMTERKRMEEALQRSHDELEARVAARTADLARARDSLADALRRLLTSHEDVSRRISRDLHDNLGQEVTALGLLLQSLGPALPPDSPARERLHEAESIVRRIGSDVHDFAVELRPVALDDLGLVAALSDLAERWSKRAAIRVDFEPTELPARLPPEVETAVYRIVQEALTNVARHAGASRVSVILQQLDGEVTALVEDDGRGFEPESVARDAGRHRLGLAGMEERARLAGGKVLVESSPGGGTTVRVRFPLPRA